MARVIEMNRVTARRHRTKRRRDDEVTASDDDGISSLDRISSLRALSGLTQPNGSRSCRTEARRSSESDQKNVQKNGLTAALFALFEIEINLLLSVHYQFLDVFDPNILKGLQGGGGGVYIF